ncbi:unnamed protein product [Rotaria magnacalcarata]|uniref:Uncharacterized protein n=2 Tax=Rotaria magnacalcarata TaxID=392030 RepID=A0A820FRN7_9BILA|nr:unnamed protein product [Rotaria magnacalcarata]CAF2149353.1 unnamed protein product [Rotaria magnacalcarata]CAF3897216.1 unnamed protein product [Rotaria magnacalcarata]CAF4265937.1 unnamed protein product [Rotaria magnacalcarata]
MRFMRERPDVKCLHGRHHISASALNAPCLSSNDDNTDVTLDILLLPNEITVENLLEALKSSFISEDGKAVFIENAINMVKAVKSVARCISAQIVLNPPRHRIPMFIDEFNIESSFDIIKSYFTDEGSQWKKFYPVASKYEYNGTDNSEAFQKHIRMDRLLGVQNDFDYPDYCVVSLMHQLESHVSFVPSMRVAQVDQAIPTISFPGLEGMRQEDISATRYRNSLTTVFPIVENLMGGFGKHDNHQLWIEDSEKKFTIENQCILSNECLLNGSSGGPVLLDGFRTSSTIDRNGNQWTFVEYSTIHFGGEYVPCCECLSVNPIKREWYTNLNDLVELPHCSTCRNGPNGRQPIVYNFALTVHHPSIFESYRMLTKDLLETFDIDQLKLFKEYFDHYQINLD